MRHDYDARSRCCRLNGDRGRISRGAPSKGLLKRGGRLKKNSAGLSSSWSTGKEKGYVLYDEVNDLLAEDYPGGRELDDLLTELDTAGVEILEEPKARIRQEIRRSRRARRNRSRTGFQRQDQRSRAHVSARDGHRPAAHARGRNRAGQAHRARPERRAQGAVALGSGHPRHSGAARYHARGPRRRSRNSDHAGSGGHRRRPSRSRCEELLGDHRAKSRSITKRRSNSARSCKPSRAA